MHKNDIIIDYRVTKDSKTPWMEKIMGSIYNYVQNNTVYFEYEPKFVKGVLVFGIVGFRSKHIDLLRVMGANIKASGGKLEILLDRSK